MPPPGADLCGPRGLVARLVPLAAPFLQGAGQGHSGKFDLSGLDEVSRSINDQRRALSFADVSEIMPDVRRLIPAHRTVGNWTLGQICRHLTNSFVGSMEGLDLRNHRIKRFFFRRQMLRYTLKNGIPRGWTVDQHLTPPPQVELDQAADALAGAVERYQHYDGRLHAHPLFGNPPRAIWDRIHCIHSAHHLSFAIPVNR